jgi:hypothetical protein
MTIAGNIQSIRDDVYAGGGPTDMAFYGQLFYGRNNCSLSEFIGRSWWKSLTLPMTLTGLGGDAAGGTFSVPARGNVYVYVTETYTDGMGGNFDGYVYHDNSAGWASFNYVDVPGAGNITKGQFTWTGSAWVYQGTSPPISTISANPVFYYAPI